MRSPYAAGRAKASGMFGKTTPGTKKAKLIVDEVRRVAALKGCTPAQTVLARLLHQGDDIVPIRWHQAPHLPAR